MSSSTMKITITIKAIMIILDTLALTRLAKMALKRPLSFSGSCGEVVGGTREVVVLGGGTEVLVPFSKVVGGSSEVVEPLFDGPARRQ